MDRKPSSQAQQHVVGSSLYACIDMVLWLPSPSQMLSFIYDLVRTDLVTVRRKQNRRPVRKQREGSILFLHMLSNACCKPRCSAEPLVSNLLGSRCATSLKAKPTSKTPILVGFTLGSSSSPAKTWLHPQHRGRGLLAAGQPRDGLLVASS